MLCWLTELGCSVMLDEPSIRQQNPQDGLSTVFFAENILGYTLPPSSICPSLTLSHIIIFAYIPYNCIEPGAITFLYTGTAMHLPARSHHTVERLSRRGIALVQSRVRLRVGYHAGAFGLSCASPSQLFDFTLPIQIPNPIVLMHKLK